MPNTTNSQLSMTNSQSSISRTTKEYDIHKRIFNFVISVLKVTKDLPKSLQNIVFIGQITRSVTSIGANDQEADGCNSRKEFTRFLTIVKKETKETNYWLKIIYEVNPNFQFKMKEIIQEGKEIEAIISSIVQKVR